MSARDILTFRADRGGSFQASVYPMAAGASFLLGEPLVFNGAGALIRATTDPASIVGISGYSSTDTDGRARVTGAPISVVEPDDSQLWICYRFATDGAGTAVTPTQVNAIGQPAGLTLSGATWTVDTGAANPILRIESVIDAFGKSIAGPGLHGSGAAVIFRFV